MLTHSNLGPDDLREQFNYNQPSDDDSPFISSIISTVSKCTAPGSYHQRSSGLRPRYGEAVYNKLIDQGHGVPLDPVWASVIAQIDDWSTPTIGS